MTKWDVFLIQSVNWDHKAYK